MAFNGLTEAEAERLAILAEELGEAAQRVGKILRHGYESTHPHQEQGTNRQELEKEIGDLANAIVLMEEGGDLSSEAIENRFEFKRKQFKAYTHHQFTHVG